MMPMRLAQIRRELLNVDEIVGSQAVKLYWALQECVGELERKNAEIHITPATYPAQYLARIRPPAYR